MPADYSHLKPLAAWLPLGLAEMPDAELLVEPMGLDNARWLNFVLEVNAKQRALVAHAAELVAPAAAMVAEPLAKSGDEIAADRREVAEMLARACVRDWRGVVDASGAPVPFSPEEALHLLVHLSDVRGSVITRLLAASKQPENVTAMEAVANP